MKKTICYCDVCGKENAVPVSQFAERKADGAGSMENWYYTVDLCAACILANYQALINTLPAGFKEYLKNVTNNKGKVL